MTAQTMRLRLDQITKNILPKEYWTADKIDTVAQHKIATMAPPPPVEEHLDPFTCGEVSDEWVAQQVEREACANLWDKQRRVLLGLMHDARNRAKSIHQTAVPRILQAFNDELQKLLRDVEEISDQVGDADTAQKAIAADAGQHWKRLTELAADYAELRRAQHSLMPPELVNTAKSAFGESHASDLFLSNLSDIWPNWRNPGQTKDLVININGSEHRYEPWPIDETELLLWLVRSDAEPWIPTEQQLQRLHEDRIARANPMPKVIQGRPDLINKPLATAKGTA